MMLGYYTPVLILQALCLYHAYKNNNQQKWYWLILFFPVFGCLIYLYENFYSKRFISNLSEGVKALGNSNHRIEQLERQVKFNDSYTNKVNLADAYMRVQRYEEAVNLYEMCLEGFMAEDPVLLMKLLSAYYQNGNYKKVIFIGEKLTSNKTFKNAEERIALAWSYFFDNQQSVAIDIFKDLDKTYTNFRHRIEYSKLLIKLDQQEAAELKLQVLMEEFEHMKPLERKVNRPLISETKKMLKELDKVKS
ncbi:MAG: tetratricopeptide repeat protein [Sporocytophaga sp.]|uniref:hypothetical protein n=1 Tax=Sporocytophaga sp. TaxID=2231183 RepID=UPI001B1E3A40|nr:hypothetical protein [Sporocytophaga sp.]MBO9702823.1 tetratricopeptide repeat protein [Sporocytophaga sp.]